VADAIWMDVLDPATEDLERSPVAVMSEDAEHLLRPAGEDDARTRLELRGDYLFGLLLLPVSVAEQDRVFYQEVDLIANERGVLTVRKTPPGGDPPFDPSVLKPFVLGGRTDMPGMLVYRLFDEAAERFADMVDALEQEIDELEDSLDHWDAESIRVRLRELRHDLLQARQRLGPMRDAIRKVSDGALDLPDGELFPRPVEVRFADTYDKILRVSDSIELLRDLVSGVRDYHQAQVANEQNEVTKRLTVLASILLFPTVVAGVYGQNFVHMPELRWRFGYLFSWGVILLVTVGQLVYFRRKGWIGPRRRRPSSRRRRASV